MTHKFRQSLTDLNNSAAKEPDIISGQLGIPIGGSKTVEVPNRNSFVYVRLRNNQNELIQAFNNKVSPSYDLPVLVKREGNRYIILSVDTQRYENNWADFSSYLPRHGSTHSFNPDDGEAGDVVWTYSRQFMPMLTIPSGSLGGPNVLISPYVLKDLEGNWRYVGDTGTANLVQYKPTNNQAIMGLVYVDSVSGNPYVIINSGTPFSASLTGTAEILPYVPAIPGNNPNYLPDSFIRLVSGTTIIDWDNIYDARQFIAVVPTGTSGGLSSIGVQDEGALQGNATVFNFVGSNVDVSISGSVARVFITGSSNGSSTGTLFNTISNGVVNRWLQEDTTMPTGSSLVLVEYINLNGYNFAMEGDAALALIDAATTISGSYAGLELLSANKTYYVRKDGSDSNTGLINSAGGAFLTIQKAINSAALLESYLYNVTIQVASGTYAQSLTARNMNGNGTVIIIGDETTPSSVLVSGTFTSDGLFTSYSLKGMKLLAGGSTSIAARNGSKINFQNLDFGSAGWHIYCLGGSKVYATGYYTVSGNAITSHIFCSQNSLVTINSQLVTFLNSPVFGIFADVDFGGMLVANAMGFTNEETVTGTRYRVQRGGLIYTNSGGEAYFPGNASGTMATQGQYL